MIDFHFVSYELSLFRHLRKIELRVSNQPNARTGENVPLAKRGPSGFGCNVVAWAFPLTLVSFLWTSEFSRSAQAPFGPSPSHRSTNQPASGVLAWVAGRTNLIVNGDFEGGDFTGWERSGTSDGNFILNDGTIDSAGPEGVQPVYSGDVSVVSTASVPGTRVLVQDITIPAGATSAVLSWADRIRNYTDRFSSPDQEFRVQIRDVKGRILGVLFATQPGDALLSDWTVRSADASVLVGQTVRVEFVVVSGLGILNVHLDDIRLEVSPLQGTTFDVYFGTNASPGLPEFQGRTDRLTWPIRDLAANGSYYWKVVARDGSDAVAGPGWEFRVGPKAEFTRFSWTPIGWPQYLDRPFAVTILAEDRFRHAAETFNGTVHLAALVPRQEPPLVLIAEVDPGPTNQVGFINVRGPALVDVSNFQISFYDAQNWPAPKLTFTVPQGSIPRGGNRNRWFVREGGTAPGGWPNFSLGQDLAWGSSVSNGLAAVLLRDAAGSILDFVCIGGALPGEIKEPRSVPVSEWYGPPVSVTPSGALTYQRAGIFTDRQSANDWIWAPGGKGQRNFATPLFLQPGIGTVTPDQTPRFVNGSWSGSISLHTASESVVIVADDRQGHAGVSDAFRIEASLPVLLNLPASASERDGTLTNAATARLLEPLPTNLEVTLSSGDPSAVRVPASITITAGRTNTSFDISIVDDDLLDGTRTVLVGGAAPGYVVRSQSLDVYDNESATLTLRVPAEISEDSSPLTGWLTIDRAPGKDVRVALQSSDPTKVVLPPAVLVQSGQTNATFDISFVDDEWIDGDKTVVLTASVVNWKPRFASMVVKDNERRQLFLTLPSALGENLKSLTNAGQVRISGKLPTPLTVNLSANPTNELALPSTVTIAPGKTLARFNLTRIVDPGYRSIRMLDVVATSPGFEPAHVFTDLNESYLRTLDVAVRDLVYDAAAARIYASVPTFNNGVSNRVAVIDPITGLIERTIQVGDGPVALALTDDGRFLYVGLNGVLAVQRLDLRTFTAEAPFPLDGHFAGDLEAIPGRPEAVAVNRWIIPPRQGARPVDLSIYVNGVRQSNAIPNVAALAGSTKAKTIFAFGGAPAGRIGETLREIRVEDSGAAVARAASVPLEGTLWTSAGNLLFNGVGRIFDIDSFEELPPIAEALGKFTAADPRRGRVFYLGDPVEFFGGSLGNATLAEGDLGTRTLGRSVNFKYTYPLGPLIRWGSDGLAFSTGDKLQILRTSFVPNGAPVNLNLVVSAAPLPGIVGEKFKFSIVVSNSGPATATFVVLQDVLQDVLPSGLELISATTSQGQCTNQQTFFGQKVVGELGILTNGASASLAIVVKSLHAGIWTNEVVVRCAQNDANPADNRVPFVFRALFPDQPDSAFDIVLETSDLIYDATGERLYASVPADARQFPNSSRERRHRSGFCHRLRSGATGALCRWPIPIRRSGWRSRNPEV